MGQNNTRPRPSYFLGYLRQLKPNLVARHISASSRIPCARTRGPVSSPHKGEVITWLKKGTHSVRACVVGSVNASGAEMQTGRMQVGQRYARDVLCSSYRKEGKQFFSSGRGRFNRIGGVCMLNRSFLIHGHAQYRHRFLAIVFDLSSRLCA